MPIDSGKLQTSSLAAYAEAHVGLTRGNAHLIHQADEIGIGPVVVNDEPSVDAMSLPGKVHLDGSRVAAKAILGFEEGDVVMVMQIVGGAEAGYTRSDDGDFQCEFLVGEAGCMH